MNDDELDRLLQDLPREADLPAAEEDAMWSEIEPRIAPSRFGSSATWGVLLAAAGLLLSIGGFHAAMPEASSAAPSLAALPHAQASAPQEGLLPAEDDLQAAVTDLERAYHAQRDSLDPALLAIYDENLEVVGDAVARSRAALAQSPADPHLQRMLRTAYDQQLSLLSKATAPQPGSRR